MIPIGTAIVGSSDFFMFSFFFLYSAVLDSMGASVEVAKYTEKLVPSTRFVSVDGVAPTVGANNFVAPSASVIGSVTLGEHTRYALDNYNFFFLVLVVCFKRSLCTHGSYFGIGYQCLVRCHCPW